MEITVNNGISIIAGKGWDGEHDDDEEDMKVTGWDVRMKTKTKHYKLKRISYDQNGLAQKHLHSSDKRCQ